MKTRPGAPVAAAPRGGRGWLALEVCVLLAGGLGACAARPAPHDGGGPGQPAAQSAVRAPAGGGGAPPPIAGAALEAAAEKVRQSPRSVARAAPDAGPVDLVTIHVLVEPPQRAHVIWGVKDFGLAPLDIRRPRGSGPLDLVIHAPGYLTLHTRAFTDRDNTLSARLVSEAEAPRFAGYQAPAPTVTAHAPAGAASRRAAAPATPAAKRAPRGNALSDGARAP